MPASMQTQVAVDRDQLTVTVHGPLTADVIIRIVQTHYPSFRGRRILWNVIAADFSEFAEEDFIRIAAIVRANTPANIERKTAYVAPSQAAFVLLWRYLNQGIRDRVPVEYQTFTDVAAAEHWLAQP